MTYPYGTKGAPAVGGGLPGLPRRSQEKSEFHIPVVIDLDEGEGEYIIPAGRTGFRVTAVGAGGAGYAAASGEKSGGGGGGVAVSPALPTNGRQVVISYRIGMGGAVSDIQDERNGGETFAKFFGIELRAGGGIGGPIGTGGSATGGERNYRGGDGELRTDAGSCGGGGAAGPLGDQGNSLNPSPGTGAGARGRGESGNARGGGGGGGVMGDGGGSSGTAAAVAGDVRPSSAVLTFGTNNNGERGTGTTNGTVRGGAGGAWGGGGGAGSPAGGTSAWPLSAGPGGNGGLRIEIW